MKPVGALQLMNLPWAEVYKGKKANIDSYSAFFDNCKANDTGLTKQLEDAGVTDVYCCGLVFDICVKSSALHGAEMGFRVSVFGLHMAASVRRCDRIVERCGEEARKALVVIDVQNDFISGTLAVQTSEDIVKIINDIRDQFDCAPCLHEILSLLAENTWGAECHKDLILKPADMSVYKGKKANIDSYSAFFDNCKANDTGLTKQLEDAGVTDVYCCGLVFDICVKSSALHGAEMGFRVSVIEDACKPLNASDVDPTKKVLNEAGVRVMSSSQAVEELKQISAAGNVALTDFIQEVAHHKKAVVLHRAESLSSHCEVLLYFMILRNLPILWGWVLASEDIFNADEACRGQGDECFLSLRQLRGERSHTLNLDYPLAADDAAAQTWPMTAAASGFCAYPSERSDPRLGSERLGASPDDVAEVCAMALKYEGHMAEIGSECATEDTCGSCKGVWCKGKVTALLENEPEDLPNQKADSPPAFPLAHENETLQTWPMTDAADGFCAYPSERSDPTLGSERLGAAPTSPDEVKKVCEMARAYEGHRAEVGSECATEASCSGCNGVWCKGIMKSLIQTSNAATQQRDSPSPPAFPLAHENETLQTWPMTDAADGFCAYPSERSDPTLGSERLGAAPTSPDEVEKVCEMARAYEGHRAEVGSECATEASCSGCNGVWCKGIMKSLIQTSNAATQQRDSPSPPAFPLAHENETLQTWPMTDAADGFCAYPSERSDPTLGSERLGAAPTSPDEVEKVCEMARAYEGHRAEVGSECATEASCSGCNGVWCKGIMKSLIQTSNAATQQRDSPSPPAFPLAHENETLQTWPMTDAADGFCAYPSERSDPTLGSERLGAAPTSPDEVEKVCEMARAYEGHRAEVGSECAKEASCSGCNGVWCKGIMKS
eukprot:Skav202291  [mRNA]  locus=scaffold3364:55719:71700:+ [translate_table: standard]